MKNQSYKILYIIVTNIFLTVSYKIKKIIKNFHKKKFFKLYLPYLLTYANKKNLTISM